MKATMSKDGVERYTILIPVRVTPDEFKRYTKLAKDLGWDDLRHYIAAEGSEWATTLEERAEEQRKSEAFGQYLKNNNLSNKRGDQS